MFKIETKFKFKKLYSRFKLVKKRVDLPFKKQQLASINLKLAKSNVWNDIEYAQNLSKKQYLLSSTINTFDILDAKFKEIIDLVQLIKNFDDEQTSNEIANKLENIKKNIEQIEFNCFFSKEEDNNNCYLDIQAGSGGIEAQDWAGILLRMYLRWAENKKFKIRIIEESAGEISGIKSATVYIKGDYAFGWLRTETGIHRLVRKSPFNSNKKRHTSFSSVFVYPDLGKNSTNIEVKLSDLKIDVYKSSGAGGQHVNRTESAVRITHIPTGIVTQCQNERSQYKNKNQALKQIKLKLYKIELQKRYMEKKILEESKSNISWGSQIRSYILDSSRIKDLRTGMESYDVNNILDGNIDNFIIASLKAGL